MAILQSDLDEFTSLWNELSDKNRQHVRNGLGDNLLQTEDQAKSVIAVMRLMVAMQRLEGTSDSNSRSN